MAIATSKSWAADAGPTELIRRVWRLFPSDDITLVTPCKLLYAIVTSDDAVVRAALHAAGASIETLESALATRIAAAVHEAALVGRLMHSDPATVRLAPSTSGLLDAAGAHSARLEHVNTEIGHLLLEWTIRPDIEGYSELEASGTDMPLLTAALIQRLPGTPPYYEEQIRRALDAPRLSADETTALLRRASGDRSSIPEQADAVERLFRSHLFLAWEPVVDASQSGHRPEYCCAIASNAVLSACLNAPNQEADQFREAVSRHIDHLLTLHLVDNTEDTI